jgi:hypothetical protein
MAHNYSPKIVTDGLIFYVDAANTKSYVSGSTIWNDLSKTFTTTNLFNTPLYTSTNNGGIVFDGVNEYGETPRLTVLRPDYVTMCAWVKYTGTQALSFVGGYGNTGTAGYSLSVNFSGNYFQFIAGNGNTIGGGVPLLIFGSGIGNICYACGSFDGTTIRGYQNGVLINSINQDVPGPLVYPTTGSSPVTGGLHIGIIVSSLAAVRYWTGDIYQIKIYNRALSATEILQNYNTTKSRFGL